MDLMQAIRKAIEASDKSRYQIAKESGVNLSHLQRAMNGETGLSIANVQRLAEVLGLEVVIRPKTRKRKA